MFIVINLATALTFALPTCTAPILLPEPPSMEAAGAWDDIAPGPPLRFLFSLLVLGGSNCPMGGIFAAGRGV